MEKKKKEVFELCYNMPCSYEACDIAGLFVIANVFFCELHLLETFLLLLLYLRHVSSGSLLFFQDSRCIVNVSNKTKMK